MNLFRAAGLVLVLLAVPAMAQLDTGTITGRVTDPTGAVIAGAQVLVVRTDTNFEYPTQTNNEGLYRVQALRPGPYRVEVSASGFKKQIRDGFQLRVNDTMAVDFRLEVGAVTETIEVKGELPLLQTETSTASQVLRGEMFYSLPIFQRQLRTALYFLPGMQQANTGWPGQLTGFRINGLPGTQIGVFEDGVLATNMYDGNAVSTGMAGVEEVNVLTSALPAEYGHAPAGVITIVKKTGTNELHATLSHMILTRSMFPRGFFERETLKTPREGYPNGLPYLYQTPDGVVTGPVWIPKLYNGKNRTFFMFSWQIPFSKESKYGQYTVPTPAMLQGDVSFGGIGQQIYDPGTTRQVGGLWYRDPIPGNVVPRSMWSKVSRTIVDHNPWRPPNATGSVTSTGVSNNIIGNQALKLWWPAYSFRIDQQFTQNIKWYVTLSWNNFYTKSENAAIGYAPYDSNQSYTPQVQYTPSTGLSWIISPSLISETRVGMYRRTANPKAAYQQAMTETLTKEAGVPGIPSNWYVGTISPGVGNALGNTTASVATRNNFSFKQDITKISGKHAFKFGYDYLYQYEVSRNIPDPRLSFSFMGTNGLQTNGQAITATGNSWAAFLLGYLSSYSVSVQGPPWTPQAAIHSLYFQDDWKILPSLTLNLGLRYTTESPLTTRNNAISVWDEKAVDDIAIAKSYTYCHVTGCVGQWTHPRGAWYNRDTNNLQPRVGLAWRPLDKFVFRGGFGLTTQDMGLTWYTQRDDYDLSFSKSVPSGDQRPIGRIDDGPGTVVWPALRADGTVPYAGTNIISRSAVIVPKNIQNPYAMNWNLGVQYQLARNYLLEVKYEGSAGKKQIGNSQWNARPWATTMFPGPTGGYMVNLDDPANAAWRTTFLGNSALQGAGRPWPNWGTVNYRSNFGGSIFHGGTVKLEKRYSYGITVLTFYTFSKAIDWSPGNPYLNWGLFRGRGGNDVRHRYVGTMNWDLPFGQGRMFLNKGGLINRLVGGYTLTWNYQIWSANPVGMGISNSPASNQQYPGWMPTYGDVLLLKRPSLRENWQDIGGDRYTQINQNPMIACGEFQPGWGNDCFTYVRPFSRGNNGRNVWHKQRIIAHNISMNKEIPIKEQLRLTLRFDYQNPFKWFNWTGLTTTLNMSSASNARLFGTPGTGEQDISLNGGHPLMWAFVGLRW